MAADPNAHRDRMLKDILGELRAAGKTLDKIERNTRKPVEIAPPYLQPSSVDGPASQETGGI